MIGIMGIVTAIAIVGQSTNENMAIIAVIGTTGLDPILIENIVVTGPITDIIAVTNVALNYPHHAGFLIMTKQPSHGNSAAQAHSGFGAHINESVAVMSVILLIVTILVWGQST